MRSSLQTTPYTITGCKTAATSRRYTKTMLHEKTLYRRLPSAGLFRVWSQSKSLSGFNESDVRKEFDLESTFDSYLAAANIDSGIRIMSAQAAPCGFARRQGQ